MNVRGCSEEIKVGKQNPLHVVTDCNSLHETVIKDSLPEDKRAAIEVLAIREMITDERGYEDSSDDDTFEQRMRDYRLDTTYHWGEAEGMKADILTKVHTAKARREWQEQLNFVQLLGAKPLLGSGPSSPRKTTPRHYFGLLQGRRAIGGANTISIKRK